MPLTCKICEKKAILKRPKTVSRLYIVTLFRVKQKVCSKLQSITAGSSPLIGLGVYMILHLTCRWPYVEIYLVLIRDKLLP